MIRTLITICLAALCITAQAQQKHNARTPDDPARAALAENDRPLVIDTVLAGSRIYPGTKRGIQVVIPKEYDGKTPACLTLGLDGNLFGAATVIPNLIRSGEMPVTIAILLQPGTSHSQDGEVLRYNRSNEFDRTDSRLATFIETEVIPFVEGLLLPDSRKILISTNPNDRAITGASSSGIAAFTVAWERPDLFSRVYSSVGTFVAMRGGNEYPAIIRKTEPQPLRIYLQDGVNDTWNYIFGDWWEQNQLMASALNYAGYEFDYKWDRGTHSITYGTRAYPDAMRWLWRGWPAPVKAGKSMNGTLQELLPEDGSGWEEVNPLNATGFTEEFAVLITDPVGLHKLSSKPGANNLIKHNGTDVSKYVANPYRVLPMHNGNKYITNTEGDIFLLEKGSKKVMKLEALESSGREIALYPNGKILVASEKNSNWLISYLIAPDGTLHSGQQFYWLHNTDNHNHTPYGNFTFDKQGNLYVATPIGIQICDQNGRVRGILPLPGPCRSVEAIAFLGDTLYARSGGKLFARRLNANGWNSWDAPIDVKSQGQG